jgi:dsRNA-specific ribonuclease
MFAGLRRAVAIASASSPLRSKVLRSVATVAEGATPATGTVNESSQSTEAIPEDVARKSPALLTLASRLKLNNSVSLSTIARALICKSSKLKFVDNSALADFGNSLLSFYVYEHFLVNYPRLPQSVLRHVVDMYTSNGGLSQLVQSWGVEKDTRDEFTRYLADQTDEDVLGRLAFNEARTEIEPGVLKLQDTNADTFSTASGSFVRALISGIYAHNGMEAAKAFIHSYIIKPRKVDIASLLAFSRPTRELTVLCQREGLQLPVSRLLAENGRFSRTPVFVVGVFSGKMKLGEGQGTSIREARTRAAVHALKSWYLYSPVDPKLPSDSSEPNVHVDQGVVII